MSKMIRNGIEYGGTATTANQVQYSPTETVADKIAELDAKTGDSGWQPITLSSGFTELSYIGAKARRIGDIVYIVLGIETTDVVPTFTVIATVPASMKPIGEMNVCGRCVNNIAVFAISRAGAITFVASPVASSAKQFMLCVSYPVT